MTKKDGKITLENVSINKTRVVYNDKLENNVLTFEVRVLAPLNGKILPELTELQREGLSLRVELTKTQIDMDDA